MLRYTIPLMIASGALAGMSSNGTPSNYFTIMGAVFLAYAAGLVAGIKGPAKKSCCK